MPAEIQGIIVIIGAVFCGYLAYIEATARYDVIIKSGAPYCPRCNRQVTYRRPQCRSCGHTYKFYGKTPFQQQQEDAAQALCDQADAQRRKVAREESDLKRAAKIAETNFESQARANARDRAYRARGIEPGPFAWFKAMPDLGQALVVGIAVALPALLLVGWIMQAWYMPGSE